MNLIKIENYRKLGFTQKQGEAIEKRQNEIFLEMKEMQKMQKEINNYSPSNTKDNALIKTLKRWGITDIRKYAVNGYCFNCIYCKTKTNNMYVSLHNANNNVKLVVKTTCKEHADKSDEFCKCLQKDFDTFLKSNNFAENYFSKSPYIIKKIEGNRIYFKFENVILEAITEERDIDIIGEIATSKKAEIRNEYIKALEDHNFNLYLAEDIKKLKFENTENSGFFNQLAVMNIDTGAGKTYNCAKLMLYILNHTNRRILFSTTKKENLADFKLELVKWIQEANEKQLNSQVINKWIKKKKKSFDFLGINELIEGNKLPEEQLIKNRGIITHHYYSFPKLNGITYNKKLLFISEMFGENDAIIIDEVDELEKIALDTIPLVAYSYKKNVKYATDAGAEHTIKKMSEEHMSLLPCSNIMEYKQSPERYRYLLPEKITTGEFYTINTIYNADGWELMENGSIDIQEAFLKNAKVRYMQKCDDTSRKKFIFVKDCKYVFIRVSTTSELICDREKLNTEEAIGGYLNNATRAVLCNQVIEVRLKAVQKKEEAKTDLKIEDCKLIKRFENRESFIEWAERELTISEYDSLISQFCREGKELYKPYIQARRKSIFKKFDCIKYSLTASPGNLEKLGYKIDSSLKNIRTQAIDRIDVFTIEKHRQIDNLITNLMIQTKDYKQINTIGFLALKDNLDRLIASKEKIIDIKEYNFLDLVTSDEVGGDNIHATRRPIHCGRSDKNYTMELRSILTYLNGVDTTGKNYNDKNLCIINARGELNIKSRRIFGIDEIETEPIETACVRFLTQGTGRIQRYYEDEKVKTKYKAIIIFYDDAKTVQNFMETKKNSHIKFNLIDIKKKVTSKQLLEHIQNNILKYNHNKDIEVDDNFLKDLRQNNKNTDKVKYDLKYIKQLYNEYQMVYLEDNPSKKKLSLREASKFLGYPKNIIDKARKKNF
jgi:hypothetical protein